MNISDELKIKYLIEFLKENDAKIKEYEELEKEISMNNWLVEAYSEASYGSEYQNIFNREIAAIKNVLQKLNSRYIENHNEYEKKRVIRQSLSIKKFLAKRFSIKFTDADYNYIKVDDYGTAELKEPAKGGRDTNDLKKYPIPTRQNMELPKQPIASRYGMNYPTESTSDLSFEAQVPSLTSLAGAATRDFERRQYKSSNAIPISYSQQYDQEESSAFVPKKKSGSVSIPANRLSRQTVYLEQDVIENPAPPKPIEPRMVQKVQEQPVESQNHYSMPSIDEHDMLKHNIIDQNVEPDLGTIISVEDELSELFDDEIDEKSLYSVLNSDEKSHDKPSKDKQKKHKKEK